MRAFDSAGFGDQNESAGKLALQGGGRAQRGNNINNKNNNNLNY